MDIFTWSAKKIRDAFVSGEVSATAITQHFLDRIEKFDGQLKAFLAVYKEQALARAGELDKQRSAGKELGKLAGVPISLKDNIHYKGELTTCASKFLTNYKAPFHATATQLLLDEGAIIIGKTNMDEFAMGSSSENSAFQKTYNPWHLDCIPGGSSGGSAAAVAARLCPISLGSDTGGSVRQPAALCGIAGYKPTYGRISRYGLVAFGSSLDQIGPLASTTEDIGLAMEILGRPCQKDATSLQNSREEYLSKLNRGVKGLKIGIPWRFLEELIPESKKNFEQCLEVYKSLGAEFVEVELDLLKHSLPIYYVLATAEASTNLARFDGVRYGVRSPQAKTLEEVYSFSKEDGFGREVKRRILLGTFVLSSGYQDAYYRKAQKVRTLLIEEFHDAFRKCDLISTPVTPFTAFKVGEKKDPLQMYLEDIYTISSNLAGLPAISIPSGFCQAVKPFGLQLLGPQTKDVEVVAAAHAFEQATDYHKQIPEIFR